MMPFFFPQGRHFGTQSFEAHFKLFPGVEFNHLHVTRVGFGMNLGRCGDDSGRTTISATVTPLIRYQLPCRTCLIYWGNFSVVPRRCQVGGDRRHYVAHEFEFSREQEPLHLLIKTAWLSPPEDPIWRGSGVCPGVGALNGSDTTLVTGGSGNGSTEQTETG